MTVTSVATVGVPFGTTVRIVDQFGNNAADYVGTVTLASSDPLATLPAPYAYGAKDVSQHTFTGVVMRTPGTQTITATDSNGFTITSPPITVSVELARGLTSRRPRAPGRRSPRAARGPRGEISPSGSNRPWIQSSSGRQYSESKRTTGKWSTLPVWISVSDSNSSSSVPKPPGKMTKPSAAFTNIVLRA